MLPPRALLVLLIITLAGVLAPPAVLRGQPAPPAAASGEWTDSIRVSPTDSLVRLSHHFILSGSVSVILGSQRLSAGTDYLLDARHGTIRLSGSRGNAGSGLLVVRYRTIPFAFREEYVLRTPYILSDSIRNSLAQPRIQPAPFSIDDLFGSGLQKSGSIVRGVTVGTNRDFSLTSGFRMQMSGNLGRDVQVLAALTDENSPIQPEGTTRTLQEVDNVFVELRGTSAGATLGDFTLTMPGGEFGRLQRKLQGAKGVATIGSRETSGDFMLAGAQTRGKYASNQFQGIDGVQGPYRLTGANGERTIIVVAGTERVYLNGERMTRGETGDYVIDYSTAEVTFTFRRVISGVSRIVVDFEYSDRNYPRTLVGGSASATLGAGRWTVSASVVRERDDQDSPIDISLSDSDRDTLRNAGNDPLRAVVGGATFVGAGKGQYVAVDTAIVSGTRPDTTVLRIYRFADDTSMHPAYAVTFSDQGPGNGDYEKVTSSRFRFVGIRQGTYAPVRRLPLPQSATLADVLVKGSLSDDIGFEAEGAGSSLIANTFSPGSREDGSALTMSLSATPRSVEVGGLNLGRAEILLKERVIGAGFVPFDRVNDVEFQRQWNVTSASQSREQIHQGSVAFHPGEAVSFGGSVGSLRQGERLSTTRFTGDARAIGLEYGMEAIRTLDPDADRRADWLRHRAIVRDTVGSFVPSLAYGSEVLWSFSPSADSLRRESYRSNELSSMIGWTGGGRFEAVAGAGWRREDSSSPGGLRRAAGIVSEELHGAVRDWNSISSALDVTLQQKSFDRTGQPDFNTVLVRSQSRVSPFDRSVDAEFFYEAASERTAKLERVFQEVPKGSGGYVYAGDMNQNHVADPEEFVPSRFDGNFVLITLPTDDLVPVIDVKSSVRLRLNGSKLIHPGSWWGDAIRSLSGESYLRVDEKSSSDRTSDVYFLRLGTFLNDRTTLAGSNVMTHDVFFREGDPLGSVRLRFTQRNGLVQYAIQSERTYAREQSVRLKWQMVNEIANQLDLVRRTDVLSSTSQTSRVRSIVSTSAEATWSYRFEQRLQMEFGFGFGSAANFDTVKADLNDQRIKWIYSVADRAQASAEFTREEVIPGRSDAVIPFELTAGKTAGRTWLWNFGLEYKVSQSVQASLNYDGRNEGGFGTVHTGRASVRALF